MVKKKSLKEFSPELTNLAKWLRAIVNRRGFAPLVKLKNMGLIKKYVTKKGVLRGAVIVGRKEHYVLTEKGKRTIMALTQSGF